MDYHMLLLKFLYLLQKRGLSYAISENSFSSPKTLNIICNFWNFFPISNNVDYHMQFQKFLSILPKHGISYAIYEISFSSQETWYIICNFGVSFSPQNTWTILCNLWNFFT